VHLVEDAVSDPVVARCALVVCDDDGGLGGLLVVLQGHIELEDVLGVLGHAVGIAGEVVDEGVHQLLVAAAADDRHGLIQAGVAVGGLREGKRGEGCRLGKPRRQVRRLRRTSTPVAGCVALTSRKWLRARW